MNKHTYILDGLTCANCANKIEKEIAKLEGINNVSVNFNTSKLTFYSDLDNLSNKLNKIINSIEPDVILKEPKDMQEFNINKFRIIRLIIGILIGFSTFFFDSNNIKNVLFVLSYCILLPKTLIKAMKILFKSKTLDENILISISVIGAFLINEAFEGFMVIALYEIGKTLEDMAVTRSKRSVKELMDIKPEYANLKQGIDIISKDPEEIKINDVIVIKVGEKVPLDGIIVKGKSHLNTSALTGESKPRTVNIGDEILSGSVNLTDIIELKVTNLYKDSTVSRILDLVENATNRKAKAENFVTKAAMVYTPIIIILAMLTGILFPIFTDLTIKDAIYRALSFLVISCPCAIAISVPLSYFAGIGKSSNSGILIKGSDYLDNLRHIKTICFDKTGTLTTGNFSLQEIIVLDDKYTKKQLLEIVVQGESLSNHPIAKSIISYYGKKINNKQIKNYKEIAGKGISFEYKKQSVFVGKSKEKDIDQTYLIVKINNKDVAQIILADEIKKDAKNTINELNSLGINTLMFTGDNKNVSLKISENLNIKDTKYEMLPEDKYNELDKLIKNKTNDKYKIAFVGDGINDAPVLSLADIGISMGSIGSASAIEASDVVIMTDSIDKILEAIKISKYTTKIIKQNLIFALGIKLMFIVLNLFGISSMSWAVFADVGVTVLCILNSIRVLKMK